VSKKERKQIKRSRRKL